MSDRPRVVFDVNFFIFRRQCERDPASSHLCRYVNEWEDAARRGDIEAIVPSGVEEVLVNQNMRRGLRDLLAGLRGFPHKKKLLSPNVISWMRKASSDEVRTCLLTADDYGERIRGCLRAIDREDMAIYAQASKAGADYIVTADRAWIGCEELFRALCGCMGQSEDEEITCGKKLPKVVYLASSPRRITK